MQDRHHEGRQRSLLAIWWKRLSAMPMVQRSWILVAVLIAVALASGYLGYRLRDERFDPLPLVSPGSIPRDPYAPGLPPSTISSAPKPDEQVVVPVGPAVDLDVRWNPRSVATYAHFMDQTVSYEAGISTPLPTTYYAVGYVASGPYQGLALFDVYVACEGPCFSESLYRVLRDDAKDTTTVLTRYSDPYLQGLRGKFILNGNLRIPDLEFPSPISGPEAGQYLQIAEVSSRQFDTFKSTYAFHHAVLGDMFLDSRNGFSARAADGSTVIYTVPIPFLNEKVRIPEVRWDDGTSNTSEYAWTDVGGCGSANIISVVGEDRAKTADLVRAGTGANGEVISVLANPDHPLLKDIYENQYSVYGDTKKLTYDQFIASRPVFFWRDLFGRLIKFQSNLTLPQAECGKPVIYLYPEQSTDVSVRVEPKGGMTVSDPAYDGGWQVRAEPDGTIIDKRDGKSYPYLFWEGRGGLYQRPEQGDVVAREEVHSFLTGRLGALGLNAKEIADFEEFWEPRMQGSPFYLVSFLTNRAMDELAPLTVVPKPKSVLRVLMDFTPLEKPVPVQAPLPPKKFVRDGFTVVEWGGVLR